jgi:hypothetical protein
MHFSDLSEVDLLILKELNGEDLAKSARFFLFIFSARFGSAKIVVLGAAGASLASIPK